MQKEEIKFAFSRVKEDIFNLTNELNFLKSEIKEIKNILNTLVNPTHNPTEKSIIQLNPVNPTYNPTVPQEIGGLKTQNLSISIGNEGVPTDTPTNQQTHQQTPILPPNNTLSIEKDILNVNNVLNSLDKLKKEIRFKFKRITSQEMLVFSTIYQLEEEGKVLPTYNNIALKLKLSPSSIRDYVQRIINKGIPIKKEKYNNKQILLSIAPDLKKIAPLQTIINLREL
jgi:hypothetical protein